ncbi:MAG: sel1 repeat family protein, partial [Polyangiaceae bacterium]|nr:sel1 repeat family protein [Polyangiaceae bacterium]
KACDAGDFLGCRKLGSLKELRKDEAAALASYQKSCDGKSASGCAWLGARMERGRGIARDLAGAAAMYESACAGGDSASCALQGFRAENRPIPRPDAADVEALYRKAVPALRQECSAGGLVECVQLGYLVQGGKGVERDVAAAGALFRKACEGGLPDGCNNEAVLGVIAGGVEGGGKAAEALRTACAVGSSAACGNLAMLRAGVPLALRQQQGVSLFAVDCNDDVPFGCTHNSAASPEPPAGVPKDLAAAVAALRQACADGVGVACGNLGAFQESGYGMSRDAALALASYEQACAAGAPDGCGTMKESPFRAGDVWRGVYTCGRGQGTTDVWLRILEPTTDARVNAVFDLDYRAAKGRFLVSGAYDAARGSITLAPGKWVDAPPGWLPVGMTGQVSAQKTVFAGKMDAPQCGPFYVVRQVSDMFDTKCGAGSRFVEGHGCVPTPREGATVLGTWAGTGTESTGRTWAITVTLDNLESGRCGRVAFPSQNCAGDWYCTMSSDGKQIRAREVITSGQGTCDSTGVVEFTVSDDGQSADYKWTSPRRSDVSSAHLARAAK